MIRRALRATVKFLASTPLVTGLLVFVSVWSSLATFVPQGELATREVAAWAASHPAVEPVVRTLGLHQAFTSFLFMACVVLLGVSTAVCSWRRTKVAIGRTRVLRDAARADEHSVFMIHDLEVGCDPALNRSEVLSIASEVLGRLRIRTRRRGDLLASVSPWWSVWGSPVFHWALVVLVVVIISGNLLRSEGRMALAVGQTKPDAPASYVWLRTGPWYDWGRVQRSIRVDAFEPDFRSDGIDRGPTPTVSILDGAGRVVITQRVYPNMMLHSGSLSINSPACGLSVTLAMLDTTGAEIGRVIQPVDFSQVATGGTVPLGLLSRRDAAGNVLLRMAITVPLDRSGRGFGEWIPKQPTAHVVVSSPDGATVLDSTVKLGADVAIPGGGSLRLVDVGWYAALGIVDDWTTPFIYAAMVIAMIGLSVTVLVRQQVVVATILEGPEGTSLALRLRLWRNTPTNRSEIESELVRALRSDQKETMS